ncbi:hypothetical protein [uncultured Microbacterium sp.]|uniref:hypothetical protein n=1 Tax=uncultured Microbacterium sp. TaxID=191216 RepID=UPI002610817F|nr:hypothetical protein [uncultured Microbacterium sp.]
MTFESVTDALCRYEAELDRIGFRHDFADGLTPHQLHEIEAEAGFRLSQDARAVWSWHGGTSVPSGQPCTQASTIVPFGIFPGIRSAITTGKGIADSAAEAEQIAFDEKRFLSLCWLGQDPFFIDSTDPDAPDSPTLRTVWGEGIFTVPAITVTERVELWINAVQTGAWYVDDTGRLNEDFSLLPEAHRFLLSWGP